MFTHGDGHGVLKLRSTDSTNPVKTLASVQLKLFEQQRFFPLDKSIATQERSRSQGATTVRLHRVKIHCSHGAAQISVL
jgi:hypothetical protein